MRSDHRAALGIDVISLNAVGGRKSKDMADGRRWGGYYFWPAHGFDGQVSDQDRDFFKLHYQYHPKNVGLIHEVREIFELEDGPAFWKLSGSNLKECKFQVAEQSDSFAILRSRIRQLVGV